MATSSSDLWAQAQRCINDQKPKEAICYLAELVNQSPTDRNARMALAMSLGDAGNPAGALKIMRLQAERLVHDGYLLPAIAVIQQGLARSPGEKGLSTLLDRLHVRGAHAKAGTLAVPPPLPPKRQSTAGANAAELLRMAVDERVAKVTEIGCELPAAGPAAKPVPLPLFGELDAEAFTATVKQLHYKRANQGTKLLEEGAIGDSLIILISGHVAVSKGQTVVGQLQSGAVIGEMALITRAPRSATVTVSEPVEYFELSRADVATLTQTQPKVMQELAAYCRGRLLMNLLRTSPVFSHFDEATRMSLLQRFRTTTIQPGDQVITAGQQGEGLYVIATGKAQVQARDASGKAVLLATLGPGDVFGEISLVKRRPATADVIATDTLGAIVLPAADFQKVLNDFPEVHKFLDNLSDKRIAASRDLVGDDVVIDPDDIVVL